MIRYEMSLDEQIEDIKRRLGAAEKDYSKKVLQRALKRAAGNYRTVLTKETTSRYYLKARSVRDLITIKRGPGQKVMYYVKVKSNSKKLTHYKVNRLEPRTKGKPPIKYKAKVLKGGTLALIRNSFWIQGPRKKNGDPEDEKGILMSRPDNLRTGPESRKPTKEWMLLSPSIAVATSRKESNDKAQASSMELLKKRIDHEIDVVLKKWEKKGR